MPMPEHEPALEALGDAVVGTGDLRSIDGPHVDDAGGDGELVGRGDHRFGQLQVPLRVGPDPDGVEARPFDLLGELGGEPALVAPDAESSEIHGQVLRFRAGIR
jgi:hypothetical protein